MKKKIAAFTMVRDEPHHLRRWLTHYNHQEVHDLYVLDHNSSGDRATEIELLCRDFDATRIPVHCDYVYELNWLRNTVSIFYLWLTHNFQNVLFSGVDELVVWPHGTLREYVELITRPVVSVAAGYELVDKNVVNQQHDWPAYLCRRYTKPVLSQHGIVYKKGFFEAANVQTKQPPTLALVHLHRFNYREMLDKHLRLNTENWHEESWRSTILYQHNRLTHPSSLQLWMQSNADDTTKYATFEPLPDYLRDAVTTACRLETDSHSRHLCNAIPQSDSGFGRVIPVWLQRAELDPNY